MPIGRKHHKYYGIKRSDRKKVEKQLHHEKVEKKVDKKKHHKSSSGSSGSSSDSSPKSVDESHIDNKNIIYTPYIEVATDSLPQANVGNRAISQSEIDILTAVLLKTPIPTHAVTGQNDNPSHTNETDSNGPINPIPKKDSSESEESSIETSTPVPSDPPVPIGPITVPDPAPSDPPVPIGPITIADPVPVPLDPTPPRLPTKRALLIGINYLTDPDNRLQGCLDDVQSMKWLLTTKYGYDANNIVLMSDDQSGDLYPNQANILTQINTIVGKTQSGDTLFVHYSGHGTQEPDTTGAEDTNTDTPGQDDCICPADFNDNGFIADIDLRKILVDKLPGGAKLRAFFDSCHSGSILDLPYIWRDDKGFVVEDPATSDNAISISGCRDNEESADTWSSQKRQPMGALTINLNRVLLENPPPSSWKNFLTKIRSYLADGGYDQVPMLCVTDKALGDSPIDI